jgi:hypothetical protein
MCLLYMPFPWAGASESHCETWLLGHGWDSWGVEPGRQRVSTLAMAVGKPCLPGLLQLEAK